MLEAEDVTVRYGPIVALEEASLAVARREMVAIVGPNGSGKSTLLRVLSGVRAAAAGRVRLGGCDLGTMARRDVARTVAVVPQETPMHFPFSVVEVVLMGRAPHLGRFGFPGRRDLAVAREAMERTGVASLATRSLAELSGGERQRVVIAKALAQEAEVLLLDEPTSHLDLRHRTVVLERVRRFVADGRSALVVSHDLNLAARSADRIALLAGGRLIRCGPPAEVLDAESLRETFEIDADVLPGPDGAPLVVPRRARGPAGAS
jgi:iron complex transport system ATP-binding protein